MPDTFSGAHGPHINVSVVVIVVVVSAVLILSGLLHLLARYLGRRRQRVARGPGGPVREHNPLVSALHGQLQQLFHMHDAGVEQAFIDALPVFAHGSIRGLKDSTDCAVCLTEFGDDDRLRLLPKCKHAFHLECIDTWLLSNSTCPLCRRSLLPDPHLTGASTSAPVEDQLFAQHSRRTTIASSSSDDSESDEIQEIKEFDEQMRHEQTAVETPSPFAPTIRVMDVHGTQRVLKVELGRVAQSDGNSRKLTTSRGARSYSMGSYEYIVDPASWELRMAPTPYPGRPRTPQLQDSCSRPTHRSALSDSVPELGVDDELFWASRGLYNPHTLSRVRELLTPIGSEGFSPYLDSSYSPGWIDIDIERGAVVEEQPGPYLISSQQGASDIKQRSSSLSRLPAQPKLTVSCFRRSFSAGMEQAEIGDEALKLQATPSICDEKPGSFSRRFSLNWLTARDKRMVFAAASPERLRPITI